MTNKAITKTELCFTTPNERGTFASWTVPFSENGVNIEAICAYEKDANTAYFRCITSDNVKAKAWLTEKGYTVTENNVVCWNADNAPGMLNKVTCAAAEKGLNFNGTYAGCCSENNASYVVISCDNTTEVENMINACSTSGSCCC